MDLKERPGEAFARHPWELARYAFFRKVIDDAGAGSSACRILDVGAGDAWLSSQLVCHLPEGSHAVCWDVGYHQEEPPVAFADERLTATATRPDARFDIVLLLDVAEHVLDDRAFVADIVEHCLAPDGVLIFSVPAWSGLMSAHDVALGHHRRYSPRQGRDLLRISGLDIVCSGGLFHSLMLPRAAAVLLEQLRGRPDEVTAQSLQWRGGPLLGGLVGAALSLDGLVSRFAARVGMAIPGLSWWALCTKAAHEVAPG